MIPYKYLAFREATRTSQAKVVEESTSALKHKMTRPLRSMSRLFRLAEQSIARFPSIQLDEIQLFIETSREENKLIGTRKKIGGIAAIMLKFKRLEDEF